MPSDCYRVYTIHVLSLVLITQAIFLLECGHTDKQTDKQTDASERPTHTSGYASVVINILATDDLGLAVVLLFYFNPKNEKVQYKNTQENSHCLTFVPLSQTTSTALQKTAYSIKTQNTYISKSSH